MCAPVDGIRCSPRRTAIRAALARQAAPRWCSTRTPVTAWYHHTTQGTFGALLWATFSRPRCVSSMTSQQASAPFSPAADDVAAVFRARYLEMVRLAGLLGADDPEDIAQEAFARLMRRRLPEPQAALGYLRAIVVNLTRNRHRHLRVVRMRTPAAVAEGSSEQAA